MSQMIKSPYQRGELQKNIIIVSGGFDPLHAGHVRMFKQCSTHEAQSFVICGLNSDEWLDRKKGHVFMGFDERREILNSIVYINRVLGFDDSDDTAVDLLQKCLWYYDEEKLYFANGGDRMETNTPELEFCKRHDIELLWGMGGDKIQSSSDLVLNCRVILNDEKS